MRNHDVIIVGGGPAGLTAGIYAVRSGLKTLILEKTMPGGQAALTDKIDNYPGFPDGVGGSELMMQFMEQALRFGADFKTEAVEKIEFDRTVKTISTSDDTYSAKAVIIASGASLKKVGCKGEEEFIGRGVSYCATCDGAFYPDKKLYVVGGGNSAVEEALFLTKFAKEVVIVHRRDSLRATKILQEKAYGHPKIDFRWNSVIQEIAGKENARQVAIKNILNDEVTYEEADGVFVFVGTSPNTTFLQGAINLTPDGYVITDQSMQTSVAGIFAAGDVRDKFLRQVSTAVGDGAEAAMAVEKYINLGHNK